MRITTDPPPARRLLWFVLLYLGGVGCMGAVALALRGIAGL